MKEIIDIVAAYDIAAKKGKRTALATVVQVEGSAYRRAGARMLITEDGQLTGAISGGCLEGDALRKARLVILQQQPMLVTYDTTEDDDARLGVGLGCNGIIHILIEPITDALNNPIGLLKKVVAGKKNNVLVTLFCVEDRKAAQPGTCLYLAEDELILCPSAHINFYPAIVADAHLVLESQRSDTKEYHLKSTYTAFVEFVKPLISLVIVGAGNDAIPLSRLAAVLGWDTTVIDGRPNYALPERFPLAQKVVTAKPDQVLSHISPNKYTAFVLMTHNYNYELALLKQLLPLPLSYVGVLGPKKKIESMLSQIGYGEGSITAGQHSKLFGPVGLDIGSEGAEEIALSIIAEIKAVLAGRKGSSLKYKPAPIHTVQLKTVAN